MIYYLEAYYKRDGFWCYKIYTLKNDIEQEISRNYPYDTEEEAIAAGIDFAEANNIEVEIIYHSL